MKGVLCRSDFRMADLKRKPTTLYLCLPAMRMGTHARWLRLMIMLALTVMERTQVKPPAPVLFVLDEFPVLGHMELIETAAGLMAGFGVKLWVIVQNIGQLMHHYEKSWETFFANAGVVTAFGVIDQESLKQLSEKLGKMRIGAPVSTGVAGTALVSGQAAYKQDYFDVPLLAADELGRAFSREKKRVLVFGAGWPPAVAERLIYYDKKESLFRGLYDEPKRKGDRRHNGHQARSGKNGQAKVSRRELGRGPQYLCAGRHRPCPRCMFYQTGRERRVAICGRRQDAPGPLRGSAALGVSGHVRGKRRGAALLFGA